jgi:peptidyl-dipeptidase A
MSDPFFQELPSCMRPNLGTMLDDVDPVEAVREWFSGIGFNVDTILENSSLYEAPGKNSHAFCVDLDRAGDVRILCNVRNTLHWHTTLLHELGHALYSAHVDRALPWSLRAEAHSLTTEGVAMFFEAMAVSEDYLAKVLGASSSQSAGLAAQLRRSRVLARLLFSRWCQVMVRFEKSAYENPEQDLDRTWWKLVQRYQLMECPQGGSGADWATKIHLSIAPVYYQNYLLGEIFAAQLRHTLSARPVTAGSTSLAPWMTDNIFAPGRRDPWPMLVETATGEPLEPGYLLAELLPGEAGRG